MAHPVPRIATHPPSASPLSPRFAARVYRHRRALGLSVDELADRTGVTHTTIRKWERGRALPRIDHADRLAEVLGISLEALWHGPSGPGPGARR
jgi:transcriptional regulator with XRE-family HTH domain